MFSLLVFKMTGVENDKLDKCSLFVFTFEIILKIVCAMSFFFLCSLQIPSASLKFFELNCQCSLTCHI